MVTTTYWFANEYNTNNRNLFEYTIYVSWIWFLSPWLAFLVSSTYFLRFCRFLCTFCWRFWRHDHLFTSEFYKRIKWTKQMPLQRRAFRTRHATRSRTSPPPPPSKQLHTPGRKTLPTEKPVRDARNTPPLCARWTLSPFYIWLGDVYAPPILGARPINDVREVYCVCVCVAVINSSYANGIVYHESNGCMFKDVLGVSHGNTKMRKGACKVVVNLFCHESCLLRVA